MLKLKVLLLGKVDTGEVILKILLIINVIIKLIIPCMNFQNVYLAIETLYSDINELICAITERPEKEQMKLIIPNLKGNERGSVVINLQPFVNSTLPTNNP